MNTLQNINGDSSNNLLYPLSASTRAFINLSFTTQRDPLFPAETAYDRLRSLLQSQFPWKVTPELLFCICRILEESRPSSSHAAPGPSHRTLLPVLRKMRIWRLMERRNLEGLASDLAALVDLDLSAPHYAFEDFVTPKTCKGSDEAEDKENIPAADNSSRSHARTKASKRSRHTTSLNDLFGDPVPAFKRHCAACEVLRSASKSGAICLNIQRTLRHTHDNDGLAFPRPPPPAPFSGSRSRASLLPRNEKPAVVSSDAFETVTSRPRRALTAMNGGSRPGSQVTNINVPISPPNFWAEDEVDTSLSEVWIKRRSQEEGWRA